jgi:signal transduction histidine kinase
VYRGGLIVPVDVTLLERLPEPVLMVLPTGETMYGNRAWNELVARHRVEPRLASLFGPPVQVLLAEACRSGGASAFLPVATGSDPSEGFRIMVRADSEDGTLAVQLSDLSEEVAWRHQLFLRNSELTVLNDVGTALSGALDLETLARRVWEQTGRIMDNANFFIALLDRDRRAVRFPLWVEDGQIVERDATRPFANGLAEYLMLGRQPLLLNGDVAGQMQQMGIARPERPCASFMGVPILSEGEALGVLGLVDWDHSNRYSRHELGILNIVATQAAAALRTAWMFEAMRLAYNQLSATQARLLESERLRGVTETVGALNHEVNNPLATIVGTAQLLLRRADLDPETRPRVERVLEAAKRIQFVTSKMATLIQATSRPYPGETPILDVVRSLAREEAVDRPVEGEVTQVMRVIRDSLPGPRAGDRDGAPEPAPRPDTNAA